jgi:predicted SnoaL-like aldol condensation-catalyzing enzyme
MRRANRRTACFGFIVSLVGWRAYSMLLCLVALGAQVAPAATYTAEEQGNLKIVADFYAALDEGEAHGDLKQRIRAVAEKYLARNYLQHSESARDAEPGREGFIQMFESRAATPAPRVTASPPKVLALVAQGDLVIRVSARSTPGTVADDSKISYIFNMFRVAEDKLAEHWDGSSGGMRAPRSAADGRASTAAGNQ